jgi:hypothetical protein
MTRRAECPNAFSKMLPTSVMRRTAANDQPHHHLHIIHHTHSIADSRHDNGSKLETRCSPAHSLVVVVYHGGEWSSTGFGFKQTFVSGVKIHRTDKKNICFAAWL